MAELLETHQLLEALKNLGQAHQTLYGCALDDDASGLPRSFPDATCPLLHEDSIGTLKHPWLQDSRRPTHRALMAVTEIFFRDGQDPTRSIPYPGLVAASAQTIQAVMDVNRARDAFADAIQRLPKDARRECGEGVRDLITDSTDSEDYARYLEQINNPEFARDDVTKENLQRAQIARISLRQVYRNIPVVTIPGLKRLAFYNRASTVQTVRSAAEWALFFETQESRDGKTHESDRDILAELAASRPNEPLLRRTGKVVARLANCSFHKPYNATLQGPKRIQSPICDVMETIKGRQVQVHLPTFYLFDDNHPPAEALWEKLGAEKARADHGVPREDRNWTDEPFLSGLKLHRLRSDRRAVYLENWQARRAA